MSTTLAPGQLNEAKLNYTCKKINDQKDVTHFKTASPAFKSIVLFVDLLCEKIKGTTSRTFGRDNTYRTEVFTKCHQFLAVLSECCEDIDLNKPRGSATLRFGHVAFRDWHERMWIECDNFTKELVPANHEQYRQELFVYLFESFGNKLRIDYGTGHELNFIFFLMGLSNLVEVNSFEGDSCSRMLVTQDKLHEYVNNHAYDIIKLFGNSYLNLCRQIQKKFRLEPAGSRGVYNMDDYQFLPFLFGAAQLSGIRNIPLRGFYDPDNVEMFKGDYMFFEAVDFILNNKRGPFNEHSYTLWGFTNLNTWDNVYRRIRTKFLEDVLAPFPIVQHLLFGHYILRWNDEE